MTEKNKKLLQAVRRALLMLVDAVEDYLEMEKTSDLRKIAQEWKTNAFVLEGKLAELKACQKTEI